MSELMVQEQGEIVRSENPIAAMLQTAIERGMTAEAMEKMVALYERMEAINSEKQFNVAFAKLQSELPQVYARRSVNDNGKERYKFAAYEDIMDAIRPFLNTNGFSVGFDSVYDSVNKMLTVKCRLSHISGHTRTNEFTVLSDKGPPGTSGPQIMGSALSYAKRYALCLMLDIVIDHDDDAKAVGESISIDQARDLEKRIIAIRGDLALYLKLGCVSRLVDLKSSKYEVLLSMVEIKERLRKNPPPAVPARTPDVAPVDAGAASNPTPAQSPPPAGPPATEAESPPSSGPAPLQATGVAPAMSKDEKDDIRLKELLGDKGDDFEPCRSAIIRAAMSSLKPPTSNEECLGALVKFTLSMGRKGKEATFTFVQRKTLYQAVQQGTFDWKLGKIL